MKTNLITVLLFMLLIASCKKDDDCTPSSLANVITGEWKVSGGGTVTFESDGTYIDDGEVLVFNPNGTPMSYTVDSDAQIRIHVLLISEVDYIVQVLDFECDQMEISVTGLEYVLTKK